MATQYGLRTPLGVDLVKVRTSLYTDDTTLFLRPKAMDVSNLRCLLQNFRKVIGLAVNIQNSEIFPIHYNNVDISVVLGDFQVRKG
jgi:predicted amino acid-binding ACT domain protein